MTPKELVLLLLLLLDILSSDWSGDMNAGNRLSVWKDVLQRVSSVCLGVDEQSAGTWVEFLRKQ